METLYIKCEQATETTECADAETISNIIHTFLEQRSKKQSILLRNRQSPQPDDADTDELVNSVCLKKRRFVCVVFQEILTRGNSCVYACDALQVSNIMSHHSEQ